MRARHTAALVLVLLGVTCVAVPTVGLPADSATQAEDNSSDGLGAQITSFTQSTAVDASSSVESGMWRTRLNASDDPATELADRATRLEQRLQRLENRTAELSTNGPKSRTCAPQSRAHRGTRTGTVSTSAHWNDSAPMPRT